MRKASLLIGICMIVALAMTLMGQSIEEQLSPVMKQIAGSMQALRKGIDSKSAADAATDAEKLQGLFTQAAGIFKSKNAGDVAKSAKASAGLAADVMKAVKAGNFDAASESAGALQKSCKACHDVHREQLPDKTYKFKP